MRGTFLEVPNHKGYSKFGAIGPESFIAGYKQNLAEGLAPAPRYLTYDL